MAQTLGVKRLQRIQWGKETVPGTAVAETTRWRGAGQMLDDQRKVEEIEEMMGIIEGADRTSVVQLLGMLQLAETPATAEQFQYLPVMAFGGPTTGSVDGPGTDKIYTTNIPTIALPTAVPYTIVGGDNFETERMEYCVCTKISLKGAMGQTARMSATLMGRQDSYYATGFAAATIPAVSEQPTQQGKLYLDAIGGVYGTTLVSDLILGFQVDIEIKWVPVFTMTGNLYYSYPSYAGHKITGMLSFLHNTGSGGAPSGQKALWRSQTPQLLRIDLVGQAVATPGTTYNNNHIILDLPIKYNATPGPLADDNGNDKYDFKFRSRYNTVAGNAGKFVVVNELASLP